MPSYFRTSKKIGLCLNGPFMSRLAASAKMAFRLRANAEVSVTKFAWRAVNRATDRNRRKNAGRKNAGLSGFVRFSASPGKLRTGCCPATPFQAVYELGGVGAVPSEIPGGPRIPVELDELFQPGSDGDFLGEYVDGLTCFFGSPGSCDASLPVNFFRASRRKG